MIKQLIAEPTKSTTNIAEKYKGTFKYHMTVFWAILDSLPTYDGIMTFSTNPHIYRKAK